MYLLYDLLGVLFINICFLKRALLVEIDGQKRIEVFFTPDIRKKHNDEAKVLLHSECKNILGQKIHTLIYININMEYINYKV